MKDYLNSNEKDQFITFLKAIDHAAIIEQEWGERGNLTKEELKALRNVITWSRKVATSIVDRQNISAKRTIAKTLQSSYLILDYKSSLTELLRKRNSDINAGYEANKDYFSLVELLMHYNCRGCTKKCTDCEIYKEFELKNIPEMAEEADCGNCKYSYQLNKKTGGMKNE